MKKILVVGSLNMDQITKVNITPKVGETVFGEGIELIPGGKGANQAVAMGKLGADVEMIGVIGKDENGQLLLDNLNKMHVKHNKVKVDEETPTGIALIMVNESGDNSIVVIPGANSRLLPEQVDESWFKDIDIVVCQLETPIETIEDVMKKAKQMGIMTVLNPAPARILPESLLSNVDLLIPNETEFEILTGIEIKTKEDFIQGFELLKHQGITEMIVTLGDKGAWYTDGVKYFEIESLRVNVVDTTAAGDSFIGGLVYQLSCGESIEEAIGFANRVAAITVTRFGAQSSLPYYDDVISKGGE